jgi:SAM-dependent methyltransferase
MSYDEVSEERLEAWDPEGDLGRRHLLNPTIFRLLGDVSGLRILDAGCGQGYLSRLLAARGAHVVGVDPSRTHIQYASRKEEAERRGIHFVQGDLTELPDLGRPFDAVVANMVLLDIRDWRTAMRGCITVLRRRGRFLFSLEHPCWGVDALRSWRDRGVVELREYVHEYQRDVPYGINFHRPLSAYINALIGFGCRLAEVAEPGLPWEAVPDGPPGIEAAVHIPNFIVVAADREWRLGFQSRHGASAVRTRPLLDE